jgi:hypothetical protein
MADPTQGEKQAQADILFYHPFPQDGNGNTVKPFSAYKLLREATQAMDTPDKPQGADRLLPAPKVSPPLR